MKKILYIAFIAAGMLVSSCSDWLEVLPKNEQVTPTYWKSKEDVEAVLASGYYYMRSCTPSLIRWGELRGASIYTPQTTDKSTMLQSFRMESGNDRCSWTTFYQVINMANSVLDYAPSVRSIDGTYTEPAMNSHCTEAYFMRALMYFYLVRNFKEVPMPLKAYVDDKASFSLAKASEDSIVSQIKRDIRTALNTGAAKEVFDETWATKGRATKWALYALMSDVCLWSGKVEQGINDYDSCVVYANKLIEATANFRPVFMSTPSTWFDIFYPGNSNESIFELQWDYTNYQQTSNSPSQYFTVNVSGPTSTNEYLFTSKMLERLKSETEASAGGPSGEARSLWRTYACEIDDYRTGNYGLVWKYRGWGLANRESVRPNPDANLIIYRMSDVLLMKAEALIMKGQSFYEAALGLINQIHVRAQLPEIVLNVSEEDEQSMMELLLNERDMEFAGECKRWYDLLRFARCKNGIYKNAVIQMVADNNTETPSNWIRSVLSSDWAWFLPIYEKELNTNKLLVQNPYYAISSNK
jgi:hypothetical protein